MRNKILWLFNGKTGYNNLVDTLNTLCEYYVNTIYADDARNIGTDPSSPKEDKYTILEENFITKDMGYKSSYNNLQDFSTMTNEMKMSPKKAIWLTGRLATYSGDEPSSGMPPYYYFYGSRITEEGDINSYGLWLVLHYNNGHIIEEKNDTNGIRPIIKLSYDLKLQKNLNSDGKILWKIKE